MYTCITIQTASKLTYQKDVFAWTHLKVGNVQGNIHEGLRKAPELHLFWLEHIACQRDELVPNLSVYGRLLEAKVWVGDVLATPRHKRMDMVFILIIPVCIKDWTSACMRVRRVCDIHCSHGNRFLGSPCRRCMPRQLMNIIHASWMVKFWLSIFRDETLRLEKTKTSSSCSIVYPVRILTILNEDMWEYDTNRTYMQPYKPICQKSLAVAKLSVDGCISCCKCCWLTKLLDSGVCAGLHHMKPVKADDAHTITISCWGSTCGERAAGR